MTPKYQNSPNPDQMVKHNRSYSSSSLDILVLKSSFQVTAEPCRASLHQRSASDTLCLVNKPYLIGPGSFQSSCEAEGCLKLIGGDIDGKPIDRNIKKSDGASSASSLRTETRSQTEFQALKKETDRLTFNYLRMQEGIKKQ
ncbi:hypothetical protein DITRI_Ditri06bG0089800 [Diplodiscus trichospermus]